MGKSPDWQFMTLKRIDSMFTTFTGVHLAFYCVVLVAVMCASRGLLTLRLSAGIFVIALVSGAFYLYKSLVLVPPYKKVVYVSATGQYKILPPGLHLLSPFEALTGYVKANPFDGRTAWPGKGQRLIYDPQRISVNCRLEAKKGTAPGFCDVKVVLAVESDCTETLTTLDDFLKHVPDLRSMKTIVNGLTNEYVRSICHSLDYESCTVQQVFENLMKFKSRLSESLKSMRLLVDSFEVEKLKFDLDQDKRRLDQEEYRLMRACLNKKREQEIIAMEAKNTLERARAKGHVLLEEARCQAEAESTKQKKLQELTELHAERMVALVGRENYTEMQRSHAVSKALGNNRVHLVPASTFLSPNDFRTAKPGSPDDLVKL